MTQVRRIFLLLLFFAISLADCCAQAIPTVIVQHYTTAEGLPSNNVMCALKDHDGFLWFGTWYGLCRFDGNRFTTYNQLLRDGSALPPRKIESIAEDAQGTLWLKTVDWKLYTFDRRTDRFHAVYDELKRHTHNLQIIKIQPTADGHILLLTKDKTLLLAATNAQGAITIRRLFDGRPHIDPQTFQLRHDITATAHGYTFYIGRDYRLFIMPAPLPTPKNSPRPTVSPSAPAPSASTPSALSAAMAHDSAQSQAATARLAQTARDAGIAKYARLYLDRDSLLWVATTSAGIYCVSKPRRLFSLITLPDDDQTGVRCIYQTRRGDIIVSTRSRNVYLYGADGQLRQLLDYRHYGIGAVYHAMEDSRGRLWLSTKGDGLVVVSGSPADHPVSALPAVDGSPVNTPIRHYRHDPSVPSSLSGNNAYMTYADTRGHIWVGTLDGGLNLVHEEADGRLSFFNKNHGFTHYPAYGLFTEVRNMAEDRQGRLWVGTIDGLMSLYTHFDHPRQIRFQTYREKAGATFANNDIYTMHRDRQGQLWVGAFGGGLQQLVSSDGSQLTFEPLGPREGLRNDVIYSITEDHQGQLWFATETGLSCYNRQTGRIRNYDRYDGLPDVQMEEAAAASISDGSLWVGCKQGILTFHPDHLQTDTAHYRTFIVDLLIDNQPYVGSRSTAYTTEMELAHDQNAFNIEFAALNYQAHSQVSYRYRLEGYDRSWRYSGSHRIASYNEVPPGSYTFVVETIDDANPSLQSAARLAIRILPPWWATWWAYLIYIGIAALIAWLVIRTILQMNRMRNEIYISQRLAKLTTKPDDADAFIDQLHRIIHENIADADFNIDAIASEMGLSRSAFYKKVKSQTGFAPVDLIKEFRLSHAAELLQTTTLSITEVAYRSGFKDAGYFGKCFRKRYGLSPREYIKTD